MPYSLGTEIALSDKLYFDDEEPLVAELAALAESHGLSEPDFRSLMCDSGELLRSFRNAAGEYALTSADLDKFGDSILEKVVSFGVERATAKLFADQSLERFANRTNLPVAS